MLRNGLGYGLEHCKANDGSKQRSGEGPPCLETKVDIRSSHQRTTDATDEHGSDGDDTLALFRKVVEWYERIGMAVFYVFFRVCKLYVVSIRVFLFGDLLVGRRRRRLAVHLSGFAVCEDVIFLSERWDVRVDMALVIWLEANL